MTDKLSSIFLKITLPLNWLLCKSDYAVSRNTLKIISRRQGN